MKASTEVVATTVERWTVHAGVLTGMLISQQNRRFTQAFCHLPCAIITPIILITHQILSFGTWLLKVLHVLEAL